ncbi:hypothetical protein FOPG_10402 [Fusarium oxysporum f. sp. conglutinans race 2 54008]|uniref:Uncharacterized protein n=1 Tax=Fusarium oxysporum f. sp. conglutinans race 2 54008 TaxID=1089457 RepID=X0HEH6_FUSOX|nr:hypothetical protein FOPG_10402 [Fusarium oxysporum f. sp. conglutinans race 2 54008]
METMYGVRGARATGRHTHWPVALSPSGSAQCQILHPPNFKRPP